MNTEDFNSRIFSIWEEHYETVVKLSKQLEHTEILAPVAYSEIPQQSVLFVGMNPSFSPSYFEKEFDMIQDAWKFFSFETRNQNTQKWIEIEKIVKKNHSYFNKFPTIVDYLNARNSRNLSWGHIDLLSMKHTRQKDFLKNIGLQTIDDVTKINDKKIRKFVTDQLNAVQEFILEIEPTIIIVANAKASRLFKNYFDHKWMDGFGCYLTEIGTRRVQTHLTGMLTGQRALNTESFKSLKWQINNAFFLYQTT
jgi:hypothetical protein